ncbi:MAG: hypothetical protein QXE04_00360 [Thermoplasmatales archaeon]
MYQYPDEDFTIRISMGNRLVKETVIGNEQGLDVMYICAFLGAFPTRRSLPI